MFECSASFMMKAVDVAKSLKMKRQHSKSVTSVYLFAAINIRDIFVYL